VFTYIHLAGWGLVHLIPVFAGGVIFALLYVWKRDLPSNMMAHFITDAAGFLLR
jgi:membrane protease YdiL (CAAX protease family)